MTFFDYYDIFLSRSLHYKTLFWRKRQKGYTVMSTKKSRSGGKYTGSHTTVTPAAGEVCDLTHDLEEVTAIALGVIKSGLSSARGQLRVKIVDESDGVVLLAVRGNTSFQELHVYTRDAHATKLTVARGIRNNGMHISFGKRECDN